jgi:precorrin-2 dehydrogenase/sirohydrochlorin ferrochelatase
MGELYPIFLKLAGRDVLVVGAGKVAWRKVQALLAAGAAVRVVALEVCDELTALAKAGAVALERRPWRADDCEGAMLVIAATGDAGVNARIHDAAVQRGALLNAVDDPERCDFYVPAVVRKGDVRVAISTQGAAPLIASRLRRHLETILPEQLGQLVKAVNAERAKLLASEPDEATRLARLQEVLTAELERLGIDLHK